MTNNSFLLAPCLIYCAAMKTRQKSSQIPIVIVKLAIQAISCPFFDISITKKKFNPINNLKFTLFTPDY